MTSPILQTAPLGLHFSTVDPFLFCAHHDDQYPRGNERFGPAASLAGRQIGMDFEGKHGWRMYHGDVVPGFPAHPHRGFETVTIVRRGFIDHSDSLGAQARFGNGDVQWLTAGRGIVHCEMFPLLQRDAGNPVELFQIWLNLPRKNKMVEPHFSMLWAPSIPNPVFVDDNGRSTRVTIIAGALGDVAPPPPPPSSYAADPRSDLAIWTVALDEGARFTLPPGNDGTIRGVFFFRGSGLSLLGNTVGDRTATYLRGDVAVPLHATRGPCEVLVLHGRPLAEPVAQHGPFVMNTQAEIRQAFVDYQTTRFGGWPFASDGPVHDRKARFARHPDGRVDEPPATP